MDIGAFGGSTSGGTPTQIKPGDTMVVGAGHNIDVKQNGNTVVVSTKDDVDFNSVKVGPVVIDSSTGINAGNTVITNVSNGAITSTSKDAVNGSQLYTVQNQITTTNNNVIAAKTEVVKGTNVTDVSSNTAPDGHTIYTVNANGTSVSAGSSAVTIVAGTKDANNVINYSVDLSQIAKDSLIKADSSLQTVVTQINGMDVKVIDKCHNTANFVNGTNIKLVDDGNGGIKISTLDDVIFNKVTVGSVIIDSTGINAGNTKITNLSDGLVTATSKDAVNGSQLYAVQNQIITTNNNVVAAKTEVVKGTNVTDVSSNIAPDGHTIYTVNANGTTVSAGSSAVNVNVGAKDANNVTDYSVDLSAATKTSLTNADNALQNVVIQMDGTNVKTVDKTNNTANFVSGTNIKLTNDGSGGIKVSTADDVTFNKVTTNDLQVGSVKIDSTGINAGNTVITNVSNGAITSTSTDAVNGSQLYAVQNQITSITGNIAAAKTEVVGGTNIANITSSTASDGHTIYTVNANGTTVSSGSSALTVTNTGPDSNNVTDYQIDLSTATKNDIAKAASSMQTVVTEIDGVAVNTIDKNNNVANFVSGENIKLANDGNGGIKISTSDDISANKVTAKRISASAIDSDSITINNGGPTMDSNGIDMNNNKITNVADGEVSETSTDAVNGSQLYEVENSIANISNDITSIKYKMNELDKKASAGTATAMAMANLPQPIEAGVDGIAVGTGAYGGSAAVALGYSRTSKTGKEVFKVSASYDTNNKLGVGMGVFIRLNKR